MEDSFGIVKDEKIKFLMFFSCVLIFIRTVLLLRFTQ